MSYSRPARIVLLTLTGAILAIAAWELAFLWSYVGAQKAIGTDLAFFVSVGRRWLETGQFYLPHQLAGPYSVQTDVDVMYPPLALLLFVPFAWLPFPLWWVVPIGIVAAAFVRFRPAMWTWPILAALVAWPRTLTMLLYGNSNMWLVAAVAAGLVLAWPAVFVVLKPSLGFFALIGINRRSWWIAAAVLALVSIPMLELWRQYVVALGNSDAKVWYSFEYIPTLLFPVVAWLGRRDAPEPWRPLVRRLRLPAERRAGQGAPGSGPSAPGQGAPGSGAPG